MKRMCSLGSVEEKSRWDGLPRRLFSEALGTAMLVAAIVGSAIMGSELTGDAGLTLLINMLSTVLALGVLIWILGPVSGAHFNPAVTLIAAVRKEVPPQEAILYIAMQISGGLLGVALANVMFDLPAWHVSDRERSAPDLLLGEVVATAGLLLVIGALTRPGNGRLGPLLVPAWIGAAMFFASSTSFANPAVTISRAFTDTFSGVEPASVAPMVLAQIVGAAIGAAITELLYPRRGVPEPLDLPAPVHDVGPTEPDRKGGT